VPTVRRSRVLPAPLDDVWRIVSDVHAQPRWWPRVGRVEGVTPQGFTQVLQTKTGRGVRADFRFVTQEEPYVRSWTQELAGTPFDRVLRSAQTTVRVSPEGDGATRVELEQRQKLRGLSRFGGFLVRKATRQVLDEALDGLAGAVA
jgi:uncharacterized protein YndB with AHSA1/START domain